MEVLDDNGDVQKTYTFQLLSEKADFPSDQELYPTDLDKLAPPPKGNDDDHCALVQWSGPVFGISEEALRAKACPDDSGGDAGVPKLMVVAATSVKSLPTDASFTTDPTFPFPTVVVTRQDGKALQDVARAGDCLKASLRSSGVFIEADIERVPPVEPPERVAMSVLSGLGSLREYMFTCVVTSW